jgi:hypothetical protein
MRENALNHLGLFDRSNDLELATTHATLNIKVEHAFEEARPTHARPRVVRMLAIGRVRCSRLRGNRHNRGTQFAVTASAAKSMTDTSSASVM